MTFGLPASFRWIHPHVEPHRSNCQDFASPHRSATVARLPHPQHSRLLKETATHRVAPSPETAHTHSRPHTRTASRRTWPAHPTRALRHARAADAETKSVMMPVPPHASQHMLAMSPASWRARAACPSMPHGPRRRYMPRVLTTSTTPWCRRGSSSHPPGPPPALASGSKCGSRVCNRRPACSGRRRGAGTQSTSNQG